MKFCLGLLVFVSLHAAVLQISGSAIGTVVPVDFQLRLRTLPLSAEQDPDVPISMGNPDINGLILFTLPAINLPVSSQIDRVWLSIHVDLFSEVILSREWEPVQELCDNEPCPAHSTTLDGIVFGANGLPIYYGGHLSILGRSGQISNSGDEPPGNTARFEWPADSLFPPPPGLFGQPIMVSGAWGASIQFGFPPVLFNSDTKFTFSGSIHPKFSISGEVHYTAVPEPRSVLLTFAGLALLKFMLLTSTRSGRLRT